MAVPRQECIKGVGGGGVVKITYPLEQMDFPLLFEAILTRSHQCQTSLLNLRRKLQYCLVTDFSVTDHDSSFMVFMLFFPQKINGYKPER